MSYSLAQAVIRSTTPAMVWLDRWPFTTEPGLLLAPCKIPLPVEAVVFCCAGYVCGLGYLAALTIAAKVCGSVAASSARILRSSSMFFALRLAISLL